MACPSPHGQVQEHVVVYSPPRPEQPVVCPSPQPEEHTIIFRPFQAQGVRTVALKQYQEQEYNPTQTLNDNNKSSSATSTSPVVEERSVVSSSWRSRDPTPATTIVHTTPQPPPQPPVVQIISQATTPDHQPATVEIELDVDLLKQWPPHERHYQQ
ncbi:hypothetical protein Pmani_001005 [Petrolisthes manimaculis]|uniref:Uncharacterized protein n=1 Tax=Petrolisthes manimaculis TaxID=1843537 RepID=A0AAE1QMX8_9EUCA|nr:hypothetical protein Pmani_001005 [Petrolisthes manimaculis]